MKLDFKFLTFTDSFRYRFHKGLRRMGFSLLRYCYLLALPMLLGQTLGAATGSPLQGKILDPSRAPVPGAEIIVTAKNRSFSSSTFSDETGQFSITLEPGDYTVKVVASGFSEVQQTVSFKQAEFRPLEIVLQIGGVRDTITVTVAETAGYQPLTVNSATKTPTMLRDVPQSITVVTQALVKDQMMLSIGDVVRYVPGITAIQGENNRDQLVIRGNSTSADFFVNGVRDDVQYYRDLYNLERVEALKGPNAMMFGRGGGGGVINRVTKEAGFTPLREFELHRRHLRQQTVHG